MGDPAGELILPAIDDLNRPFWDGCAEGELRMQACLACGRIRYPCSGVCPSCLSPELEWRTLSGEGEILSWVVFRHRYHPAWAGRLPYNVVLVQLREGPRMFGNVEPLDRQDLAVGSRVRVVFVPEGAIAIPRWTLVQGGFTDGNVCATIRSFADRALRSPLGADQLERREAPPGGQ